MKAGHSTTRESNSVTKAKTERRHECKDRFLNGFLSANEYLIAISLTIGREDYNLGTILLQIVENSEGLLDDTDEDEDNSEHCHVCLFPRSQNFALLHNQYVHGGFCESCAFRLLKMKAACPICRNIIKGVVKYFNKSKTGFIILSNPKIKIHPKIYSVSYYYYLSSISIFTLNSNISPIDRFQYFF